FLQPASGALSYTGQAPAVAINAGGSGTTIPFSVAGAISLTGRVTGLAFTGPDVGRLGLTGRAPAAAIAAAGSIPIPVGTLALTGRTPSGALVGTWVAIPPGSLVLSGQYFSVEFIQPSSGALTFAGQVLTVASTARVISFPTVTDGFGNSISNLQLVGRTPTVVAPGAVVINVPKGTLDLVGRAVQFGNRTIDVPAGAIRLTGQYVGVKFLTPLSGSLIFTGQPLTLSVQGSSPTFIIPAGVLALHGQTSSIGVFISIPLIIVGGNETSPVYGQNLELVGRAPVASVGITTAVIPFPQPTD